MAASMARPRGCGASPGLAGKRLDSGCGGVDILQSVWVTFPCWHGATYFSRVWLCKRGTGR
eukprot:4169381-Lingulodinium_polyedra.AAC.1